MLTLSNFSIQRPGYQIAQRDALAWLSEIHAAAQATIESLSSDERAQFATRMNKLIQRVGCGADKIGARGHVSADLCTTEFENLELYDVTRQPRGRGTAARSQLFSEIVNRYFEREYAEVRAPPSELIHVTCTGYVAPSGAQHVVALIAEAARVLAPGGLFCFHTFNRSFLSWLVVIKGVEWFVRNTPRHLHVLRLFLKPEEVRTACARYGLGALELRGVRPQLGLPFWRMLLSRRVADDFGFAFSTSTRLGYSGLARKTVSPQGRNPGIHG